MAYSNTYRTQPAGSGTPPAGTQLTKARPMGMTRGEHWPWEHIVSAMWNRRNMDSDGISSMIQVRDNYNGDVVVPVFDVQGESTMAPPSPRLVADIVDNLAMRAASARPSIYCPALEEFKQSGVRSQEYADIRRKALYGTWHKSALTDILLRRAYRHWIGYGSSCLVVVPDFEEECARVELRDPLTAYPDLRSPEDVREPRNVGFIFGRSAAWIRRYYPEAAGIVGDDASQRYNQLWDLVEWIDENDVVIGLLGPRWTNGQMWAGQSTMELRRWPNKAGMVPVAIPRRVTMDRIMGQVWAILGLVGLMDKLNALDILAAEKAVFGDMVVLGENGRTPQLVGGRWKDGREGEPNIVVDGKVQILQNSPGPLTHPVIDRLERDIRTATGLMPQMQGENNSSLRTGRAIDSLGGFAIDPRIQESQEVMARGLTTINKAIFAVKKGYWGAKKYTYFSGWPGDTGQVEFTPNVHFETDDNVVAYTFPGTDVSSIGVGVLQLTGGGLMSHDTARRKHPWIDDPDMEGRKVLVERMEDATMNGVLQKAVAGQLDIIYQAHIHKNLKGGMDIDDAIIAADNAARALQATQATPTPPGAPAAPEAQPGLGGPALATEPAPSVGPVAPSMMNLRNIIGGLASTTRGANPHTRPVANSNPLSGPTQGQ